MGHHNNRSIVKKERDCGDQSSDESFEEKLKTVESRQGCCNGNFRSMRSRRITMSSEKD